MESRSKACKTDSKKEENWRERMIEERVEGKKTAQIARSPIE